MKGLFLKDLYSLNVYKRTLLIVLAVFVVLSLVLPSEAAYIPAMTMVFMVMVMTNMFTLDDSSNWDRYAISLPFSRQQIVWVRYLFFVVMAVVGNIGSFVLSSVISIVRGQQGWLQENLLTGAIISLLFLLIAAINAPLCYKFGAEKSRMAIMMIYFVLFLTFTWGMSYIQAFFQSLSPLTITLMSVGAVALTLAIFVGSYFLSARIYVKKEL